mmetsp:Transcript_73204/g.139139  ORF Transcript_73204/g.139139 Transcript_73204/m.139139 type:complete len:247 (-) Transcript_73204:103-843(-)
MVDLALESRHLDRYEFYATHSTGLSKHPQVLALADALAPLALPPLALASCALQVLALGSLRQRYLLRAEGHPLGAPPQLLHLWGQRLHCSLPHRLFQPGFSQPGLRRRILQQTWTLAPSCQTLLPHPSRHLHPPRARHCLHRSRARLPLPPPRAQLPQPSWHLRHPRARRPSRELGPPRARRALWLQDARHHSQELHVLSRPDSALPVGPPLLPAPHSLSVALPRRSRLWLYLGPRLLHQPCPLPR